MSDPVLMKPTDREPALLYTTGLVARHRAEEHHLTMTGTSVDAWADISGNANHMTDEGAGTEPTWSKNGWGNGRGVVSFDGTERLQTTDAFTIEAIPNTLICVCKPTGGSGQRVVVSGNALNVHTILIDTTPWEIRNTTPLLDSGVTAGTTEVALFAMFNNTASEVWVNGSLEASGSSGTGSISRITAGARSDGTQPFTGLIAEIMLFDHEVTDANLQSIYSTYLKPYYNLP